MPARSTSSDTQPREIWQLFDSRNLGGLETHVMQLAEALSTAGFPVRIMLLTDYGPHPMQELVEQIGVPMEALDGSFGGLRSALRSRRPRLVHTHGYKGGLFGRIAARLTATPVVSTFHAGDAGTGKLRLYTWLDEFTAFLAPAIAVSDPIADRLNTTATVLDNFVSMPGDKAHSAADAVAFVGRIDVEKGPDLFCQLSEHLPEEVPLVMFGDGPMRAELEAEYGSRIDFRGQVTSMAPHWREIGLLCMSSRNEGLPMAALEAMARRVPVAAFDVGDLHKAVVNEVSGWLTPAHDVPQLAAAIRAWYESPSAEKEATGIAARVRVENRFSPKAVLPKVLEIYNRTTAGPFESSAQG